MNRAPVSRILGTGHYLPPKVVTNDDLSKFVDTSDEWIRERTGIRQRHVADDAIATSDMAAEAAKRALEAAGVAATEIDLILVATVTPDHQLPATAVFVQQKIGAGPCPALDIGAACAGFVYALTIADQFIAAGTAKRVLVIGVELLSRILDWNDRTTCVLFGDGAGAAIIGPAEGATTASGKPVGVLASHIQTDGALAQSLWIPAGGSRLPITAALIDEAENKVHMRGQDVFKVAVKNLFSASKKVLEKSNLGPNDVDWICPHQANLRIIDSAVNMLGADKERVLVNIDRVGNTSSASIPILLDESIRSGKVKPGETVLMCALGAGISWGAAVVTL